MVQRNVKFVVVGGGSNFCDGCRVEFRFADDEDLYPNAQGVLRRHVDLPKYPWVFVCDDAKHPFHGTTISARGWLYEHEDGLDSRAHVVLVEDKIERFFEL